MAERRMLALTIVDSDDFLDLPCTAQNLYFHLNLRGDDDGFVNKPKSIARMIGCKQEDLQKLVDKGYLISFPDGVVVIRHWRINNFIRKDRYTETIYKADKDMLELDETGIYNLRNQMVTEENKSGNQVVTSNKISGNQAVTQVRLDKDSIGKDSIGEINNARARETNLDYDAEELNNDFDSTELAQTFNDWIECRSDSRMGPYLPAALADDLSKARTYEKQYGAQAVIDVLKASFTYKRPVWDRLERSQPTARSGTQREDGTDYLLRRIKEEEAKEAMNE